ncbi:hypothetical protein P872_12310 [Rhodonellum psychrophilum GCM71 = DSM 17998]|uniref:Uncharacterized protein n=2 Tax=Rhodonellum TaxID=336827 RepID=U5BSQ0_9BACT|nr:MULTISPECIES: hypothetical protein [Rhodonellum]ERM80549.1 hypothetical protein P872_12310 [Rhodonellum psychrophilum GCM71 = DSM 17998]SDZ48599.1 hypothetical protein SAMN05444412_1177 [Rhodonellum ikkaensis]
MDEFEANSGSAEEEKRKRDRYLVPILSIFVGLVGWLFYSFLGKDYFPSRVIGMLFWLIGLNIAVSPFERILKKFLLTRVLLKLVQGLLIIALVVLFISVSVGSVYVSVILVFMFVVAPIKVGLDLLDIKNSSEIAIFLSFTFSSIAFSYKGNAIINRITIFWRGRDKEKIQRELELINTYLGEKQIRFFIYLAYFLVIISATVFDLAEVFKDSSEQNFLYLTLQSFAAFLAFEALIEKKSLMKPWTDKFIVFRKLFPIKAKERSDKPTSE